MAQSLRRSEQMTQCDLFIQPEAAFEILSELGEMGCVQFLDTKEELQIFQRSYVAEVRRFAEMERKLRYIEMEVFSANITIPPAKQEPRALNPNETLAFENFLDKWEDDIVEMSNNEASLMQNYAELVEMEYVLDSIGPLLGDGAESKLGDGMFSMATQQLQSGHLYIFSGVVRRSRSFPFEMMLWRISRGNLYYKQASEDKIIYNPQTGQDVRRVAFLAICQGEELSARAEKVCAGFRVKLYPIPKSSAERNDLSVKISSTINDLEQVVKKTKYHKCKALRIISRQWSDWSVQVRKASAIYHNLNRFNFDVTKNCLIGRCWVAERDLNRVQNCLETKSKEVCTNVQSFMTKRVTTDKPPTYFRMNKFTAGFQHLINAYGAASYKELNPGLYTIITFPFLFAMMFGDIGHGLILVAFGCWMISGEKKFSSQKSTNEIWNIMYGGRYVILLLGLFSMFTGFLYNDVFSRSIDFSGSWLSSIKKTKISDDDLMTKESLELDLSTSYPYAFGLDPIWMMATNKVMVENSIKMKLSIILGIIHMEFGVILSVFNHIYFKKYYLIYLQFIPELLIMTCLFAWLVILIYLKWFFYKEGSERFHGGCAPQILIIFIDMFLMVETKPVGEGCDAYLFEGQRMVQMALLFIALISIPVLLFGTPVYLMNYHNKKRQELAKRIGTFRRYQRGDVDKEQQILQAEVDKHTVSFGELMIHQAIHTIEYVLSTVSHTASYLRLWALSLAHAALSEMLWDMVLEKIAIKDHSLVGAFKLVIIFAVWAFFTICILVVMEGLSAFLHTLRLHWVEFMTKFFEGAGWLFQPFSFATILAEEPTSKPIVDTRKHRSEKN